MRRVTAHWHAPARSAERRAKYLGVSGRQVVKPMLVLADGAPLLALLAANDRLDFWALAEQTGAESVLLARPSDLARVFPDAEYGVIPGQPSRYKIPAVLDWKLAGEAPIFVPSRFRALDFAYDFETYCVLEGPRLAEIAAVPEVACTVMDPEDSWNLADPDDESWL